MLIVRRDGKTVQLFTRRGYDWTARYPAIAAAAAKLRAKSFTLDGEAVVTGADGVAVFDALHRRHNATDAMLYVFDLLEPNGKDQRPLPLGDRKAKLARLLGRAPAGIVFNQHTYENGAVVFRHACKDGARGDRVEAARRALPVRALAGLDQGEEPGQPGDAAGAGGDVVITLNSPRDERYPSPTRR